MYGLKNIFSPVNINHIFQVTFKSNSVKVLCSVNPFAAITPVNYNFGRFCSSQSRKFTESKILSTDNVGGIQSKKRPTRKKWTDEMITGQKGKFNVMAFASAEEYNLEGLVTGLMKQDLYEPKSFFSSDNSTIEPDVLYVKAKYKVEEEPRDIFFFREGTVVLWNVSEIECSNILSFLKKYEEDKYNEDLVADESEVMPYSYNPDEKGCALLRSGQFILSKNNEQDTYHEKYTFSNALSLSVKLGIWEAALQKYIESMEPVTIDLKRGKKIKITRQEMLKKTGELFALKHLINLSSDLLDTPDFYWDREQLEHLYSQTCAYFSISRRTRVMNEKLNHCVELADIISSNLNDKHHIRLEWMIIVLIMVEVLFECIHYGERYFGNDHNSHNNDENSAISIMRQTVQ